MADTLDVTTVAAVKDMLNLDDTDRDDDLQRVVTAVSRRLDDMCGPVVRRTITDERHRRPTKHRFLLRESPVATITSVVTWVSGTPTALTAETDSTAGDYRLDNSRQHAPWLVRRSGWDNTRWDLSGDVLVTYSAGRATSTADVDSLFIEAAHIMAAHLFKSTGPGWHTQPDYFDQDNSVLAVMTPRFAVPNAVVEMLYDELRPPAVG